jgi:hypothetical protein
MPITRKATTSMKPPRLVAAFLLWSSISCGHSEPDARDAPSTERFRVDHVIVAVDSMERGIELLRRATGVTVTRGGAHPGRGTQNALLNLDGGRYLELLAPNPEDTSAAARAFAVERTRYFSTFRALTPVGWAIQVPDAVDERARLLARGLAPTEVSPGTRIRPDGQTLRWRAFGPWGESFREVRPFVIEWLPGSPHPTDDLPSGCRLSSFTIATPAPDSLRQLFAGPGWDVDIRSGAAERLELTIDCPAGLIRLPA